MAGLSSIKQGEEIQDSDNRSPIEMMLDQALSEERETPIYKDSMGTHKFPYCGLRHLYEKLVGQTGVSCFGMDYYTSNGISMHLALQRHMGRTGRVLGDWSCKAVVVPAVYEYGELVRPGVTCDGKATYTTDNRCPKCGAEMVYDELGFKYGRHLIGRADGLFVENSRKRPIVGDYKSSSIKALEKGKKYKSLPYTGNVHQIEAYVVLLELELQAKNVDVELSKWALIYLARDNPVKHKAVYTGRVSNNRKKLLLRRYDIYDQQYHTVMFMTRLSEARFLMETKPCKDESVYRATFGPFAECPLAENGVCWRQNTLEKKLKKVWMMRKEDWQQAGRPKYLEKFEK